MPIIKRNNRKENIEISYGPYTTKKDHPRRCTTIQYKTKEDNTIIQQYNPLKDLATLYNTVQYNERLNIGLYRTIQDCKGEKGLRQIKFLFSGGPPANNQIK